ncbi:MAG: molybdopterin-dependent oxidoreductase, partial [Chloroflexi bacterium]|nr:molybdopterin-dependent oxidoreductase [Chloroflexota bacterium]
MWLKRTPKWALLVMLVAVGLMAFSCSPIQSGSLPPASDDLSYLVNSDPAKVDNTGLPVTPVEALHLTGSPSDVDISSYRLAVDGRVDSPLSLTYEEVKSYPAVTEVVLLICPGFFVDNGEWTGVPVSTLLDEAGIKSEASSIVFHASGAYQQTLTREEVQAPGVFLAYAVDGQTL